MSSEAVRLVGEAIAQERAAEEERQERAEKAEEVRGMRDLEIALGRVLGTTLDLESDLLKLPDGTCVWIDEDGGLVWGRFCSIDGCERSSTSFVHIYDRSSFRLPTPKRGLCYRHADKARRNEKESERREIIRQLQLYDTALEELEADSGPWIVGEGLRLVAAALVYQTDRLERR